MPETLPIPQSQLHYADPAENDEAQTLPITARVDAIHYPTLGCPALLTPEKTLSVLLSLPSDRGPESVSLFLLDRHGKQGEKLLMPQGEASLISEGPEGKGGKRRLFQVSCSLAGHADRLYDLVARWQGGEETQPNAVRIYASITGSETVLFCGDTQYHVRNAVCLERFIEVVNALDDVAWVALIGDACDNGVRGPTNMLRLAAGAKPGQVSHYYAQEFRDTAALYLPQLNKPVVILPGNHDGMVAYRDYEEGTSTEAYVGPDPKNEVAYDGLHHFRRSFGPLYFAFDWGKTRYVCTNTFELDRHDRLGYHAIVANWGGHMRKTQVKWLAEELAEATRGGKHKVVLGHHDPRGGSEGKKLGYYSAIRPYLYESTRDILLSYLRYLSGNATKWQQEWMRRADEPLKDLRVKKLLSLLLDHEVWAFVMGHDNESWVDSYSSGEGIFTTEPRVRAYAATPSTEEFRAAVKRATDQLASRELEALVTDLGGKSDEEADLVLEKALERLEAEKAFSERKHYAPNEVNGWGLRAKAPIHFAHVDDVGAYKHTREKHFSDYGYVLAKLDEGRPVSLQRVNVLGEAGPAVDLLA